MVRMVLRGVTPSVATRLPRETTVKKGNTMPRRNRPATVRQAGKQREYTSPLFDDIAGLDPGALAALASMLSDDDALAELARKDAFADMSAAGYLEGWK